MERALNLEHIAAALGEAPLLPTPEELRQKLADTEFELLLYDGDVADDLVSVAWYLHSVGSATEAADLYAPDRQRRAHQVAAHIFDLATQSSRFTYHDKLEMTFAGQVSYLRGELTPNASALYRRLSIVTSPLGRHPGTASLEVGVALLAFDPQAVYALTDSFRHRCEQLRADLQVNDLMETPYGAAERVILGSRALMTFLTSGDWDRLDRAIELFWEAVDARASSGDLDSRWVASHLLDIADGLRRSSPWALLPPDLPRKVAHLLTRGTPPVLTLWPPQVDLLSQEANPLNPEIKRLILSLPTSAGKTLLAGFVIGAHLAAGRGSVCVVVPTHSLAREVRRDLRRRLRLLGHDVIGADLSTTFDREGRTFAAVMTPEALAAQLRSDPGRLLDVFSMFVIDEAHLVGDKGRGWVLESVLSFLHEETRSTEHRILLLSAALGNAAHFVAWMGEESVSIDVDWRGPRRVHAIWSQEVDWRASRQIPPRRPNALPRREAPYHGVLTVRTGQERGAWERFRTTGPLGKRVEVRRAGMWVRDANQSTRLYRVRVPLARLLGRHGPVLIIESTKADCQRFAEALAEELPEDSNTAPLVALAISRLEHEHPLVRTLRKGVGFHHAALPEDVQAELEDAVRQERLRYLVSTTTLIEGVNLPVRSVLIGSRSYRTTEGSVTTLDEARLLNAVGRAGRATKETEGWVVLADYRFDEDLFRELGRTAADISVWSELATTSALESLARFEDVVRAGEDAVLTYTGKETADFISYVWFVASALEELHGAVLDDPFLALQSTLAWQQLDEASKERWLEVARHALQSYSSQPPERRHKWARAGTSVATSSQLDTMAAEIAMELEGPGDVDDLSQALDVLLRNGRMARLLASPEVAWRGFKARRNDSRTAVLPVDATAIAMRWMAGRSLIDIGVELLAEVEDDGYRHEQLSEFSSTVLEHYLPWVLQTLIAWVNELTSGPGLPADLPSYLRNGVDNAVALELRESGVRSRRLAMRVSEEYRRAGAGQSCKDWLKSLNLNDWRVLFDATASELSDLLTFVQDRERNLTARILAGEEVEIDVDFQGNGPVVLSHVDEEAPPRIGIWDGPELLGYIPTQFHEDISLLLESGVPVDAHIEDRFVETVLTIRAMSPEADPEFFGD